jgi:hypothetical protein
MFQVLQPTEPPKGNNATTAESFWKTNKAVPLTRESFLDLLSGRTPVIHTPNCLSGEQSEKLLDHLLPAFSPYLHATGPPVEKVGVAQFEFQAQSAEDFKNRKGNGMKTLQILVKEDRKYANDLVAEKEKYFQEANKLRNLHEDVAKVIGVNAWKKIVDSITELVPEWDVSVASEGEGKEYFSGIFRKINGGVPIHCDWCPYDTLTEDWILRHITCQAVFNLYITPTKGGGTTLYDVQWTEEALKQRDPASYGYFPELVAGKDSASWQPGPGDLYIFNSRNMHTVAPIDSDWKIPRIALASFMGLLPSEFTGGKPRLIFWS